MRRILFINELAERTGIENAMFGIISHLDPSSFTPVVACPDGPFTRRLKENGVEHIPLRFHLRRLRFKFPFLPVRPFNPLVILWKIVEGVRIARVVRRHRIDLIHTTSLSAHIAGLVASRLTGAPVVWHIHLLYPRQLYRFALPDRVVFVSDAVRRAAFPRRVPPRALVIYNGVEPESMKPGAGPPLREEFGLTPEHLLAGVIAHIEPIKGTASILRAWRSVVNQVPNAHLLLVGAPITAEGEAYLEALKSFLAENGLDKTVTFAGFRTDIPDVLRDIDLYVSFSEQDALPIGVIEAMMARKAVVAGRVGGIPELIEPGVDGVLVESGDIQALARAIIMLLQDPETRRRLGDAAEKSAAAKFSLAQYLDAWQAIYRELLAPGETRQ